MQGVRIERIMGVGGKNRRIMGAESKKRRIMGVGGKNRRIMGVVGGIWLTKTGICKATWKSRKKELGERGY